MLTPTSGGENDDGDLGYGCVAAVCFSPGLFLNPLHIAEPSVC